MKDKKKFTYARLFISVFKLSACTFGGGFVIIPLMRKRFVNELKWIEEQEMLDMTAIAQSAPGAIAVNASILVGYRVAGVLGALLTVLGTIIPPLFIISVISLFYQAFRDNTVVNLIMSGMICGVAAVIFDVVIDMAKMIIRQKKAVSILVLILSFIAVKFFSANIIAVIVVCGVVGAAETFYNKEISKK